MPTSATRKRESQPPKWVSGRVGGGNEVLKGGQFSVGGGSGKDHTPPPPSGKLSPDKFSRTHCQLSITPPPQPDIFPGGGTTSLGGGATSRGEVANGGRAVERAWMTERGEGVRGRPPRAGATHTMALRTLVQLLGGVGNWDGEERRVL